MNENTMEARMYTAFCSDFDLKPEWLGKKFTDRGTTYTVTGLNPRSKKFPVTTDKGTRFSADYLIALITNTVDKYRQKQQNVQQRKQEKMLKEARAAFHQCEHYGIPKTWLDKTFKYGRKVYAIVGITSDRQYPVVTRSNDGKVLFFAADLVRESVGKDAK